MSLFGHTIPKRSHVVPNIYGILHDPEVFPDPEEFRPERFLETDPVTGALRYVNTATGETSDTRPTELPKGWIVKKDPATGKPIYVNTATGETLRTRPSDPPPRSSREPRARPYRKRVERDIQQISALAAVFASPRNTSARFLPLSCNGKI